MCAWDGGSGYHTVEWTSERVERLWNFYSSFPPVQGGSFSRQYGRGILWLVWRCVDLSGAVVDFGCGSGNLVEELLRQGFRCRAIDLSTRAIDRVRERFAGNPGLLSASVGSPEHLPLEDGEAGAIFAVEVLEHLGPELATKAFAEFHRVLRPDGHLIVTVPNEEDLGVNTVVCPDCGCVFHRKQHVQRYSVDSLALPIRGAGFEIVFIASVHLKHFSGSRISRALAPMKQLARVLRRRPNPHLLAIARRLPKPLQVGGRQVAVSGVGR